VLKWICSFVSMTKTIKISDKAQKELKVFAAKAQYSMSVIASDAILQYIKSQKNKIKTNE